MNEITISLTERFIAFRALDLISTYTFMMKIIFGLSLHVSRDFPYAQSSSS